MKSSCLKNVRSFVSFWQGFPGLLLSNVYGGWIPVTLRHLSQ